MEQYRTAFAPMIRSALWDLGLPALTYYGLHFAGLGDTAALTAGTGAAGLRLAWVAVRSRRLSPFSLLMAAGTERERRVWRLVVRGGHPYLLIAVLAAGVLAPSSAGF